MGQDPVAHLWHFLLETWANSVYRVHRYIKKKMRESFIYSSVDSGDPLTSSFPVTFTFCRLDVPVHFSVS